MFYDSSPGYNLQLRGNYLMPVSQFHYYPELNFSDFALLPQYNYHMNHYLPNPALFRMRINGFHYAPEPYTSRVLAHRENLSQGFRDAPETTSWRRTSWIDRDPDPSRLRVLAAPGRRRRRVVFRDDDTSISWRSRIHGFNVPNRRWILRDPNPYQGLVDRERERRRCQDAQRTVPKRKKPRKFPVRKPLQISNLPKRRWTSSDASQCQAFSVRKRKRLPPGVAHPESSLQVSNLPKRKWTSRDPSHFRAVPQRKRKRLPPGVASKESTLQVSNFPQRRGTSRNPSHFRSFPHKKRNRLPPWIARGESSLQVPAFQKRQRKRLPPWVALGESSLQVPAFQKRRNKRPPPQVAPRESSLQVPAFQKRRSRKFRKWLPLRISNQWIKRSHRSYACFKCKKLGHFAIRCPQNMAYKSRLFSSASVFVEEDGLEYAPPTLICQCGLRCSLGTRKKTSRKAYACPLKSCKTFRWEDEVEKDELISVPRCLCRAGFCRQYTELGGTEVGRKYFACPIKKGQGACTFFKLLNDESLTNNRHVDERISPHRFTIGNCSDTFPASNVQKEIRSNVLDTVEYYPNQREISANQEVELMEVDLGCEEDKLNKTPRKCNKRLRDGAPKSDSSFSNTVVELVTPRSYSEGGDTEGVVHVRKSMCVRQISIEENALAARSTSHSCYTSHLLPLREDWLMTAAMNLNIELFKGWWGRLAYPPAPCLKLPEAKPFYCCVFPSFDPIFVPQIVDEVVWHSRNRHNPKKDIEGSLMFGSISDQFARVARDLQNKLISLLKSSDFRAHDYMAREANITFTALDQLQVQSQTFCERVNELIRSASILDKAEGFIIRRDQSYDDYQDHYYCKKRKRDDLISDYDVAKADMETYKERFHSLSEEASCQQIRPFQVEARVSSCEAENKYHEPRCAQISVDLIESEKRLQVAEEDLRLLQQRKEKYNAAEAAYKKARIELGI